MMPEIGRVLLACALATGFVGTGAWAEEAVTEVEVVPAADAPAAPAEAPAVEPAPDAAELATETPAAPSNQDVWWGNRSIAFGNYIKFDKSTAVREPCIHGCYEPCGTCPECRAPMIFDKIFFDLDKSVLRPEGREECDKVVAYMNAHPEVDVIVQGHCCDLATDEYNIGLGDRRAAAVKRYLIDHGIDGSRVSTRTFGEREPWQPVERRELNRRAIVIVVTK